MTDETSIGSNEALAGITMPQPPEQALTQVEASNPENNLSKIKNQITESLIQRDQIVKNMMSEISKQYATGGFNPFINANSWDSDRPEIKVLDGLVRENDDRKFCCQIVFYKRSVGVRVDGGHTGNPNQYWDVGIVKTLNGLSRELRLFEQDMGGGIISPFMGDLSRNSYNNNYTIQPLDQDTYTKVLTKMEENRQAAMKASAERRASDIVRANTTLSALDQENSGLTSLVITSPSAN